MGRYPFEPLTGGQQQASHSTLAAMYNKMMARDYTLPEGLGLSVACTSLLRRLLEPDENQRIRMDAIMQVRAHARIHTRRRELAAMVRATCAPTFNLHPLRTKCGAAFA